jgi:ribosomal protein S18 acetylase RimI-like enzyme
MPAEARRTPEFRPAERADLPTIAGLAQEIWREHYPGIISAEQIEYMLERLYARGALEAQWAAGRRFWLATFDTAAAGYAAASVEDAGETLFLNSLYVRGAARGQGLGAGLLGATAGAFPAARRIRLTVNRQNFRAINFYFKSGFVIAGLADKDIGDGYVMNDFVMTRDASFPARG